MTLVISRPWETSPTIFSQYQHGADGFAKSRVENFFRNRLEVGLEVGLGGIDALLVLLEAEGDVSGCASYCTPAALFLTSPYSAGHTGSTEYGWPQGARFSRPTNLVGLI